MLRIFPHEESLYWACRRVHKYFVKYSRSPLSLIFDHLNAKSRSHSAFLVMTFT